MPEKYLALTGVSDKRRHQCIPFLNVARPCRYLKIQKLDGSLLIRFQCPRAALSPQTISESFVLKFPRSVLLQGEVVLGAG